MKTLKPWPESETPEAIERKRLADAGASFAMDLGGLEKPRRRGLLLSFVPRIEVHPGRMDTHIPRPPCQDPAERLADLLSAFKSPLEENHPVLSVRARLIVKARTP